MLAVQVVGVRLSWQGKRLMATSAVAAAAAAAALPCLSSRSDRLLSRLWVRRSAATEAFSARELREAKIRIGESAALRAWECAEGCVGCCHSSSRCEKGCLLWRCRRSAAAGVAVMR